MFTSRLQEAEKEEQKEVWRSAHRCWWRQICDWMTTLPCERDIMHQHRWAWKPVGGVYHHDCFKNWNGLFIGCQSRQKHTASCISPSNSVIFIIIFFIFDRSIELQIFGCSLLVIRRRRRHQSDVYYFPAAGGIIYEGRPRRLPAGFKQEAGWVDIKVIKSKSGKEAQSKVPRLFLWSWWKEKEGRKEGRKSDRS